MRGLAQPGQCFVNHPIDRSITLERFEIRKPPTLMTLVNLIINSGFAFETQRRARGWRQPAWANVGSARVVQYRYRRNEKRRTVPVCI